jgi:hypothetical protein
LTKGSVEIGVALRGLTANEWYVGRKVSEDKAPFGQPLYLRIKSADLTVSYGVADRWNLSITVPFSHGTHSRIYADGLRHQVSAAGLGDITVTATHWLLDPTTHGGGIAIGVGLKTPSGQNDVIDTYYVPGGTARFTVDQSIQPGDGGWGVVLQAQAFHRMSDTTFAYGSGSYLVTPRNETVVLQAPTGPLSAVRVSVPDVFQARGGVGYRIWPAAGLIATAGARVDGIPQHDLVGRSDGFRRPVVLGYADLGLTLARGRQIVTFSLPVRAYANFRRSLVDRQLGLAGGGDLADYLVFAGYSRRFGRSTTSRENRR